MAIPLRLDHADFAIRELQDRDLPAISHLAERIWRAYYPAIISTAQIEYMLNLMYSVESLREQLASGHRFWVVETGGELAGYASAEAQIIGHWHIHKLYVDQERARQGLGAAMLSHLAQTLKPRLLTLTVNRKNIGAVNFYFKQGFSIDRVLDKNIGGGFVMEDFIMRREE